MSGGVDSAVALLRAGPEAVGVTLRLWLDPEGRDTERACCSPGSVIAAREACHGLGLPHVTLDLREEFRRAVVEPFVRGYARGETPNPCTRCNGGFRFAELLAFARRAGAARLATGHYARIREHRGRLLLARAADRAEGPVVHARPPRPREAGRGSGSRSATRPRTRCAREAAAAGLAAAERAESQEACFLAGDDYRLFLERRGLAATRRPDRRRAGAVVGAHRGHWRFTPGPAARARRRRRASRCTRSARAPRTNTVVVGPAGGARADARSPPAGGCTFRSTVRTSKVRYRSAAVAADVERTAAGSASSWTSRPTGSRPGRPRSSTRATPSSAPARVA